MEERNAKNTSDTHFAATHESRAASSLAVLWQATKRIVPDTIFYDWRRHEKRKLAHSSVKKHVGNSKLPA